MASLRQGSHKTKTRAEVRGGGRKPYKQKGTGNARQGSIRSPQFRGGGIVFGKTPRDYTFKMNKKERTLALATALTDKFKDNKITVVDSLELKSLKTADFKEILKSLNLEGKILFISGADAENLYMASRNMNFINVILANELNVYDIVNANHLVIDENTLEIIEEVLK